MRLFLFIPVSVPCQDGSLWSADWVARGQRAASDTRSPSCPVTSATVAFLVYLQTCINDEATRWHENNGDDVDARGVVAAVVLLPTG